MEEIYISRLELQRRSFEYVVSYSNKYNFFLNHVIQTSIIQMNIQDLYVSPTMKSKDLMWTHLLSIIKFLFSRKSYVCPIHILNSI